jgi:CRISPR-associated endonuclease Cas3-HD
MEQLHPAHIKKDDNGILEKQSAAEHCRNTAKYASKALSNAGLYSVGYLAGIIHDMGKFTEKFRTYIEKSAQGEEVRRGSVNHTFVGLIFLFEKYHNPENDIMSRAACELIAYAVGAHHGLFDGISPEGMDGYLHRLNSDKTELCYEEAVFNYFSECASEREIDGLFYAARKETQDFLSKVFTQRNEKSVLSFSIAMTQRLLLSALIDADRRDTAEFMTGIAFGDMGRGATVNWADMLAYAENKIEAMDKSGEINAARCKISAICKNFAKKPGGIYRLSVPTGSGKTLSTLRYALAHAAEHPKRRIFFIIPLLSVIEQNAGVIHNHIENQDLILEHHSNIIKPTPGDGELSRYELLAESWDSSVVISTLVQLLDTLFSDKTSCIRRMHALADSIIIIDEVQSLPLRTVSIMDEAINYLTQLCNATVVLCSATQPCLEEVSRPLRLGNASDIVPYDPELWRVFKRTEVIDKCTPSGYSDEEVADFITEQISSLESLLMICNTKATAMRLYKLLDIINRSSDNPYLLFHLSTSMCTKHRADTLEAIKANLGKQRVVCISTQLVEAGVDFSFECVIRAKAGLDNVAQAAGRCNRNGEFHKICSVFIINLKSENLGPLKEIENAQNAVNEFLYRFSLDGSRYGCDMLSETSVGEYYKLLYNEKDVSKNFDYPVPKLHSSLYNMLSDNSKFARRCKEPLCQLVKQAFKTAGENFKVFDDNTADVIVPYGETADKIIADLYSERAKHDLRFLSETLVKAKPYTVSIFEYQKRALETSGGLHGGKEIPFMSVLPRFYDNKTGLQTEAIIL